MNEKDTGKRAAGTRGRQVSNDEGMALITVVLLAIIFSVIGFTLFAMATFELNQATYRDQSASAFWLAEAAIEHGKGEVLRGMQWNAGFDSVPRAEGWYNLTINPDSTFDGEPAQHWLAQGYVHRSGGSFVERDIEIFADVRTAAGEYALFSMHDIVARGNAGMCGLVHGNGEVDNGGNSFDPQLDDSCRGGEENISEDFEIIPPGMRTEPSFYPNTSYYYIVADPNAGPGPGQVWVLRALTPGDPVCADSTVLGAVLYSIRTGNGAGVPQIRAMAVDTLDASDGASVVYGGSSVSYKFWSPTAINNVFDWTTGKCRRDDRWDGTPNENKYVIVNFGEYIDQTVVRFANLDFDDTPSYAAPIKSSVFNTRYNPPGVGDYSLTSLVETTNWFGGNNVLTHVKLVPENGVALLIHNINYSGPAQIQIGTQLVPAVFYITGSITGSFGANGDIWGTTIVLGTINKLVGDIAFHYEYGYQANLPPYLQPFWQNPSGHVDVLLWRELPAKYQS